MGLPDGCLNAEKDWPRRHFMKHAASNGIHNMVRHYLKQQIRIAVAIVVVSTLVSSSIISLHAHIGITFTSPMTLVLADPHHCGTFLAGGARALLFRSRDKGDSWVPVHFAAELRATLHAILIDPARPNTYLVAVSSETPLYAGVFRSVDEGSHWEQLRDLRQKQIWSLAFWAADSRVIAAGSQDGVYLREMAAKRGPLFLRQPARDRAPSFLWHSIRRTTTFHTQAHHISFGKRPTGARGGGRSTEVWKRTPPYSQSKWIAVNPDV